MMSQSMRNPHGTFPKTILGRCVNRNTAYLSQGGLITMEKKLYKLS